MPLTFTPRHFSRRPAEIFYLRSNALLRARGAHAEQALQHFRKELDRRLGGAWPPAPADARGPGPVILFQQGEPKRYLKRIRPLPIREPLPVAQAGKPGAESYRIEVDAEGIRVWAATPAGFRYALATLWDLFEKESAFFAGGELEDEPAFPFRAFLLNLAHSYLAPRKGEKRQRIAPFDPEVARTLIEAIGASRFNAVIIDVENAVRYRSHPEIGRSHSRPMEAFRELVRCAGQQGVEVIPKTNFSKSPKYRHNDWFEPYHQLADGPEYYARAGRIMAELIDVARPRYYHIGMDEDHRDPRTYVETVKALRAFLLQRGITPLMWIDMDKPHQLDVDLKMLAALEELPRQKLLICYWQYYGRLFDRVSWLQERGYTVLGTTLIRESLDNAALFAQRAFQQGGAGMLGSCWAPVLPHTQADYLAGIVRSGQAFWKGG